MIQKTTLILINLIFGSLVLLSYYNGLNQQPELSSKLSGGVPTIIRPFIVGSMFVSAFGFFFFTYNFLVNADVDKTLFLGRFNYWTLHLMYLLVLIPSMLWIDFTFKYMLSGTSFDWIVVVATLFCVALASIFLFLFTIDMKSDGNTFIYLASVVGVSFFTFHTLFLDFLVWTIFYHRG